VNRLRPVSALMVVLVLLSALVLLPGDAGARSLNYRLVDHEIIGEGTRLLRYDLVLEGSTLPVRKIAVDLQNPHVEIQAMHPKEGFNQRQTVRQMATEEDAVAAVNADFFHLTRPAAPLGLHMQEGEILSSPSATNTWLGFGIDQERSPHIRNWGIRGEIILGGVYRQSLEGYNQTYRHGGGVYLFDRTWGVEVSSVFFSDSVLQVTVRNGVVTEIRSDDDSISVPPDGFVVVADGDGAESLQRHLRRGTSMAFNVDIEPEMALDTSVGGHLLLVKDGQPVDPSDLSSPGAARASRTAVGVDASGSEVYLVTVDGTPALEGVTMEELSVLMGQLGAERALNLDGGGSSAMVARSLGELDLGMVSSPRHGFERAVPNAIGIFNRAPETDPSTLFLRGAEGLLIGTEASYEVSGHDEHYHPLKINRDDLQWEVSDDELAEVSDGTMLATGAGEVNLRVSLPGVTQDKTVRIFGGEDIAAFSVNPGEIRLLPGQQVSLSAEVETVTGVSMEAGPQTVSWEADIGTVDDNRYRAGEEDGFGTLTAEIDGHVKEVPIRIGGRREPFFTFQDWQEVSFRSHPEDLPGSFEVEDHPDYVYQGERSGRLNYDFSSQVDGVMIAYGQLGSGQISMGTNNLGVSAHVYGDASGHWLRAEIFDAQGQRRYVDLARAVDWKGWQRVQGEIDPAWPQPLILSSIYLVFEPDDGNDTPDSGTMYVDHVEMIKGLAAEDDASLIADMKMWVGSSEYVLHGESGVMDATPFIDGGRTFIPVRYLGKAFDAEAEWTAHPDTGLTDEVILESAEIRIEMIIGERVLSVVNRDTGEMRTVELDVAPLVLDGRTYLPFRAIAEDGFGARVDYSSHPDTGGVGSVWVIR